MIEVYDVELSEGSDAGTVMEFECPKCHEKMAIAKYSWRSNKCKCGYHWYMTICAYTDNDEENE